MTGFGGVHKKRRRTGAGQGGGNFMADMPRLAHAADHYAPLASQQKTMGLNKVITQRGGQSDYGLRFNGENPTRLFKEGVSG